MKARKYLLIVLAATAATFAACSSPEESARAALVEVGEEWQAAVSETDPGNRVAAYSDVIEALQGIVEDYPETPDGRAIASGREVVGGRSLQSLRAMRDELAARASCYSNPSIDCLTPLGSSYTRNGSAAEGSAEAVFTAARTTVCDKGFAAADRLLEPFKINKPVYSEELVQVALAAAACSKPVEVVAAIDAYRAAVPDVAVNQLISIVSTDALKPAWSTVMAELERRVASGGLSQNEVANVTLTVALRYALLGDAGKAIARYKHFTDTLNYQADPMTKYELGAALIKAGAGDEGMAVVASPNTRSPSVVTVSRAARGLADEFKITQGQAVPQLYNIRDIREFFTPVAADERQRVAASAAAIEAELDKLAPLVTIQDSAITQMDTAYGALALVQQKLGAADKASALIVKGAALRDRLLPAAAQKEVGLSQFNAYAALIALAHGKHAEAAELVTAMNIRHEYARLILKSFAVKGDLEQCLALANTIQPNLPQSYTTVIESFIEAGRLDDAERAIAAFAGNADAKRGMYWLLAQQAATEGDVKGAEKFAEKYSLVAQPRDRLRFLGALLGSEKIAGSRRQAEPLIREIFTIGSQMDASASNSYDAIAQNAAWHAFHNGYTDLGIELYRAAGRKDQKPMFEAFNEKLNKRDMPVLLMLAHDNLRGEPLGYVIDAAIRYLNREAV